MYQTKVTEEQFAAYQKDRTKCPICKAENGVKPYNSEEPFVDEEKFTVIHHMTCTKCGQDWEETYALKSIAVDPRSCDGCEKLLEDGDVTKVAFSGEELYHAACYAEKYPNEDGIGIEGDDLDGRS